MPNQSPLRIIKDQLQALAEGCWKSRGPFAIDEADGRQVAEVHAVFVAKGNELHAHEVFEGDELEALGGNGVAERRGGFDGIGDGSFLGPKDVNGVADFGVGAVEEDIHGGSFAERGDAAVDEAGGFEGSARAVCVFAAQENVHIAGVAYSGHVHPRNPCGHRITANDGVGYTKQTQSSSSTFKTIPNFFDRLSHACPGNGLESLRDAHGVIVEGTRLMSIPQRGCRDRSPGHQPQPHDPLQQGRELRKS